MPKEIKKKKKKKMKIYKRKDKIVIEIPFYSKRSNPYMPGEDVGEYQTLTGLICNDEFGNEEMGFATMIDMDYKDKPDQIDGFLVMWSGEKEEFKKICKELGVGITDLRDEENAL